MGIHLAVAIRRVRFGIFAALAEREMLIPPPRKQPDEGVRKTRFEQTALRTGGAATAPIRRERRDRSDRAWGTNNIRGCDTR